MLCSLCKQKNANVHLTQIAGDKMQKVDLCEDCAREKGVDDPAGFSLADMLLGLGASQEMEEAAGDAGLACPACGFTQADFKKSGRLGCPVCYETFAEGLEALLKSMHKGTRHAGKIPAGFRRVQDLEKRLNELQTRLDKAVGSEDFEQAAVLRDDIKKVRDDLDACARE
jgi:protein arginine kinase activator